MGETADGGSWSGRRPRPAQGGIPLQPRRLGPARAAVAAALLEESNRRRLPDLVPIRDARMRASPFAFLRGAPGVMAHDLATTPVTGITVQACGDAHLLNFGLFATPERNLSFGLNDFDETLPGPWEWDVKRLATSFVVAARTVGFDGALGRAAALAAVRTYREQMIRYAGLRLLDVWYSRVDASAIVAMAKGRRRQVLAARLAKAAHHTSLDAMPRLTEPLGGSRRFVENPPLLTHVPDCDERWVAEVLGRYRSSLSDERRGLLARFRPVDAARKVVGVGSVGTRCYVVLLLGKRRDDDPLLLQVKQATASVLEPYAGRSRYRHPGHRVVNGQRLLQTASDIFLGWTGDGVADYYIRQLWDMKGGIHLETLDPDDLAPYGRLCGWVLARAHARSGDASAIAGYLGSSDRFDQAIATFAEAYADQTKADYAAFSSARDSSSGDAGRVAARTNGKEPKDDPLDPGHVGVRGHPGVHARPRLHRPGPPPPQPPGALTVRPAAPA